MHRKEDTGSIKSHSKGKSTTEERRESRVNKEREELEEAGERNREREEGTKETEKKAEVRDVKDSRKCTIYIRKLVTCSALNVTEGNFFLTVWMSSGLA